MPKRNHFTDPTHRSGRGRPSNFRPEYSAQVEKLCKLGATDKVIAGFFEVSENTITRWKKQYPAFCDAVKRGKLVADMNVANRLYDKGIGYAYREEQPIKLKRVRYQDGKKVSDEEYVEIVTVTKLVPADVQAQIFWLTNRRRGPWHQRPNGEGLPPPPNGGEGVEDKGT